jgi:hypothetical protein
MVHNWEHQRMMYIKMVLVMVMVTVLDINTNLSGNCQWCALLYVNLFKMVILQNNENYASIIV